MGLILELTLVCVITLIFFRHIFLNQSLCLSFSLFFQRKKTERESGRERESWRVEMKEREKEREKEERKREW